MLPAFACSRAKDEEDHARSLQPERQAEGRGVLLALDLLENNSRDDSGEHDRANRAEDVAFSHAEILDRDELSDLANGPHEPREIRTSDHARQRRRCVLGLLLQDRGDDPVEEEDERARAVNTNCRREEKMQRRLSWLHLVCNPDVVGHCVHASGAPCEDCEQDADRARAERRSCGIFGADARRRIGTRISIAMRRRDGRPRA
mmetsp:Transcript_1664/g.3472  ORF Transcript_1664/g.3472 Transcript_1664/m.3472 type:complete len:203 (+) Transcript_1664:265-873(+)